MALQRLDVSGDRDGLNVFEVLIPGALSSGQELLDCPVIGGSRVSVTDRNREKLKEFFSGGWSGARDDDGELRKILEKRGQVRSRALP